MRLCKNPVSLEIIPIRKNGAAADLLSLFLGTKEGGNC